MYDMNGREIKSLLFDEKKLADCPDKIIGHDDLQEICISLAGCLALLDQIALHPYGNLSLYEEKINYTHIKGWQLRTEINDIDVALGAADMDDRHVFRLSAWECSPGAKLIISSEVSYAPRIRETYTFSVRKDSKITADDLTIVENMPVPSVELKAYGDVYLDTINNTEKDFNRFTMYSLYKVNKHLALLRGDDELV